MFVLSNINQIIGQRKMRTNNNNHCDRMTEIIFDSEFSTTSTVYGTIEYDNA